MSDRKYGLIYTDFHCRAFTHMHDTKWESVITSYLSQSTDFFPQQRRRRSRWCHNATAATMIWGLSCSRPDANHRSSSKADEATKGLRVSRNERRQNYEYSNEW